MSNKVSYSLLIVTVYVAGVAFGVSVSNYFHKRAQDAYVKQVHANDAQLEKAVLIAQQGQADWMARATVCLGKNAVQTILYEPKSAKLPILHGMAEISVPQDGTLVPVWLFDGQVTAYGNVAGAKYQWVNKYSGQIYGTFNPQRILTFEGGR